MLFGKHGQDFAINDNVCFFEHVDETGIGETVFANSSIDLQRPQCTEGALLGAAIAEGVHTRFQHGWTSKTNFAFSSPLVSFDALHQIVAAFHVLCTAFYSRHSKESLEAVGH